MADNLTWDEWVGKKIEHCIAEKGAADNATTNTPQAYPLMSWMSMTYKDLRDLFEAERELFQRIDATYGLLQQLLNADKSVPRQELEARAELLGLFVKALRDRTTQGGVPP